jgi:hypothetical protein
MSDISRYAYLVLVRVVLIGGSREAAVDVFPAGTHTEAEAMAYNSFIQAPEGQGLMYGDRYFNPEAVASLTVKSLAAIDLTNPDNHKWQSSLALFNAIASEEHTDGQTEQDRYFKDSTGDAGGRVQQRGRTACR